LPAKAEAAMQFYGRIDMLFNNGGISQRSPALETSLEVDRALMQVNYLGPVALTKAVLPSMIGSRQGHIVVISSLTGKFGAPLRSGYAASKHALHGFFDALRAEIWKQRVFVTLICPGYIRTDISVHALKGDGSSHGAMDEGQANGMAPSVCAAKILKAVEDGKEEALIGGFEKLGVYLKRFVPGTFSRMIRNTTVTG
jgi:short-subunit dehydrogenase